jgi:hypothetical protein
MTNTALRAIETEYRGRFRSRTEARWAVALDAAGIAWQYEAEGFVLNGTRYLPDFFLPELKTYVEVKPTKEAAEQAAPLLLALIEASGCGGLFAIGSPTVEPPDQLFTCSSIYKGRVYLSRADVRQCPFCDRLSFMECGCAGMRVLRAPRPPLSRFIHALGEAQRARFEFSETGKPRPYVRPPTSARQRNVYVVGPVLEETRENDGVPEWTIFTVLPWREEIFGKHGAFEAGDAFCYAGPTIIEAHGASEHGLAQDCLREVEDADLVFAWVDREDTLGTLVEIGAAYAEHKPIFAAFANEQLAEHFYFIKQLATVAVITPDVMAAWKLFTRWQA